MGFPLEHGLRATLLARRLCDLLDTDVETARQVYFAAMLMYSGCTSEAALGKPILEGPRTELLVPHLFGGPLERLTGFVKTMPPPDASPMGRGIEVARKLPRLIANGAEQQTALCEVAEMLSRRLGLPDEVGGLFTFLTERWDGMSVLRRAKGDDIPLAIRIVILSRDIAFQRLAGGDEHAVNLARERASHAFDPEIAEILIANSDDIFSTADAPESAWEAILEAEPEPWLLLTDGEIDRALAAVGDFADLVSPSLSGHSAALANLVARAAEIAGFDPGETRQAVRAAHVHDVGRVAIDHTIWGKTTPLNRDEYEQIRLHPYHTERILSQSPTLGELAAIARDHHERLDGTGYHRGVGASALGVPARLLAAADTFQAMSEPRPHRPARGPEDAAKELARLADEGLLDPSMVGVVIEAAGQPVPEMERTTGMTERETEVIGLLARGLQTKQIATALGISPKTADTHIQNAYRKMSVSTRAAATLYAMEHGLVRSGERQIPG